MMPSSNPAPVTALRAGRTTYQCLTDVLGASRVPSRASHYYVNDDLDLLIFMSLFNPSEANIKLAEAEKTQLQMLGLLTPGINAIVEQNDEHPVTCSSERFEDVCAALKRCWARVALEKGLANT